MVFLEIAAALINNNGKVIGITVSGVRLKNANQGINFFIHIEDAMQKLKLVY